jgi:hypothetical protein
MNFFFFFFLWSFYSCFLILDFGISWEPLGDYCWGGLVGHCEEDVVGFSAPTFAESHPTLVRFMSFFMLFWRSRCCSWLLLGSREVYA